MVKSLVASASFQIDFWIVNLSERNLMRYPNLLTPGKMTFILILGLIVGTIMFKVVLAGSPFIPKNFPTGRAIAATGLVYVSLYAIWAKREEKKGELEYRQQLQSSLELLQQLEKKKSEQSK